MPLFPHVFGGNPLKGTRTTFFDVCDVANSAHTLRVLVVVFNFQVQKAVEEREKDIVKFMTRNLEDDDSLEEPEKPRKVHKQ